MVERTSPLEGKKIFRQKLASLTATHCRILLKLMPVDNDFLKYNSSYLSKVLSVHQSYVDEMLEFLNEKDIVSFDGENYFLIPDNIMRIEEIIGLQPAVMLKKKIDEID
jgi:predicted P-loop ATPase/GTPase